MSNQRFVLLIFAVAAILGGSAVHSAAVTLIAQYPIVPDNQILGVISTSGAVSVISGIVLFFALIRNTRALSYVDDVVGELRQVTWPSRDEAVRASTTVVLSALFVAALIALYDTVWKQLADRILFTES